jgi:hypothetical protein
MAWYSFRYGTPYRCAIGRESRYRIRRTSRTASSHWSTLERVTHSTRPASSSRRLLRFSSARKRRERD